MVLTDARGIATAPRFTANHSRGNFTVTATALGVASPAVFALTNIAVPAAVTIVSGNNQHASVTSAFATPLAVKVTDAYGQSIAGIAVEFAVANTSGAGAAFGGTTTVATNASGVAAAPALLANTAAGSFTVEAWVTGVSTPVTFTLANTAVAAASITPGRGTPQSAPVGKAYSTTLQALVTDIYGNPVPGATVTFAVVPNGSAGGQFAGRRSVTAITNSVGLATAPVLTANSTVGSFTVTAAVGGVGTTANFALNNTVAPAKIQISAGSPQSMQVNQAYATDLAVVVLDAKGNPIGGVIVTFTVQPSASGSRASFGGSDTATATTTSSGVATAPLLEANGIAGSFTVVALVAGLSTQLTFALTNI
jgi:hypothetical protein